jgi:hypothetical protein
MQEVIQGKWDDLINRTDLHGRQVRIIVLDEPTTVDQWLKSLHDWADSHSPLEKPADDSRENIYGGTVDDPR